jgi:hypothetical protein
MSHELFARAESAGSANLGLGLADLDRVHAEEWCLVADDVRLRLDALARHSGTTAYTVWLAVAVAVIDRYTSSS